MTNIRKNSQKHDEIWKIQINFKKSQKITKIQKFGYLEIQRPKTFVFQVLKFSVNFLKKSFLESLLWDDIFWASNQELLLKSWLIIALLCLSSLQAGKAWRNSKNSD